MIKCYNSIIKKDNFETWLEFGVVEILCMEVLKKRFALFPAYLSLLFRQLLVLTNQKHVKCKYKPVKAASNGNNAS